MFGPPPPRIDPNAADAFRPTHSFVPPREAGETLERPALEFPVPPPVVDTRSQFGSADFEVVGPRLRLPRITNGAASGAGGRKTAEAQAKVSMAKAGAGAGMLSINGKSLTHYFPVFMARELVLEPLLVTETLCDMDVQVEVHGGGKSAQAGAVRLAIGRALQNFDPSFRWSLKMAGALERDSRQVERKKTGKPKARRSKQWSKR